VYNTAGFAVFNSASPARTSARRGCRG